MSVEAYLMTRIATNLEMQRALGLTQRQIGTQLTKLGDRVVKIKNGRSPNYALTTSAFGEGDKIKIWEVDAFGRPICIAHLRPLSVGGFFVEAAPDMSRVFLGEAKNGLFDDLPFFLLDMAPKGYLGKKIAMQLAEVNDHFPSHLSDWRSEHIGRYLLANTDGSVGNLKFGNNANLNLRPAMSRLVRSDYIRVADEIIQSGPLGTSAGGEQPKFATFCEDINAHVLVKFSPKGEAEIARRWKDILISEHYAADMIAKQSQNVSAAETHLFEDGGRIFLESKRFDRVAEYGRNSMLSLSIIDAEFVGSAKSWIDTCYDLYQQGLLSAQNYLNVEFLSVFAKYIHNTDTHLGNISFATHSNGFSLLPIYDMCSMGFAPNSNGEVRPFGFNWPELPPKTKMVEVDDPIQLASLFWAALAQEPLISTEFRRFILDTLLPHF